MPPQIDHGETAVLRRRLERAEDQLHRQSRRGRLCFALIAGLVALVLIPSTRGLVALVLLSAAIVLAVLGFISATIGVLEAVSPSGRIPNDDASPQAESNRT